MPRVNGYLPPPLLVNEQRDIVWLAEVPRWSYSLACLCPTWRRWS